MMDNAFFDEMRALLLVRREELAGYSQSTEADRAPVELDQTRVGRLSRIDALQGQEMAKAQECFLTGTAAEVTPVREIDGKYTFTPGDVCRTLMSDFDALVGRVEPAKSTAA